MELYEVSQSADHIGKIVATAIGFCTLAALLFRASQFLVAKYQAYRRKKLIKGLLLTPSTEELAQYSKGSQSPERYEEKLERLANRKRETIIQKIERQKTEGRLLALATFFAMISLILALWYGWQATFVEVNRPFSPQYIEAVLNNHESADNALRSCTMQSINGESRWGCRVLARAHCRQGKKHWCTIQKQLRGNQPTAE